MGVLTATAVVAAPGTGPANALDGCGGGTAATRPAAAADPTDVARTGGTVLAVSSTTEATVTTADPRDPTAPTDPTAPATDDPSPDDRPTSDDATVSDPGVDDPTDPSPTTETPGETESPGPNGGPAEPVSLSVTAEASPAVVEQGDTLVLTIAVSNDGPGDDPGVVVDTQLPDGFTVDDWEGPGFDDSTGLWEVGELVSGQTEYLALSMTVTSEPDQVSAGPTVTGEAADSVPMDDQDCATVEVTPSSPRSETGGPGGGPDAADDAPATSAVPGSTPPDDRGTPSTDDDPAPTSAAGGGDTTASPGTPGGSGADETAGADPMDPTATTGTAGDAEAAQNASDVSSDRTSSEAALLMLAWMLVVAGVVLLVLGRLRRKKMPAWYL